MKQTGFIEYKKALVFALLILGVISTSLAEVQLTLKNSFIKKYKNRATISASCVVDHSKGKANSPSKDGDMHIAVRCPKEIALPLVAEFMNAREHKELLLETVNFAESGSSVQMSGAWRIWNEHGGDSSDFVQGNSVVKATNTNPDHVFEIHPITQFNGTSVLDTLHPIDGYEAKDSTNAFRMYEASRSFIESIGTRTRITTSGVGYNYVKFQMELNERPFQVEDGSFAFAKIQDWEGDLILRKKRMVFVKDSPPELAVRNAKEGDCFRVLGIPRVSLSLVSWRTSEATKGRKKVLEWNLPYEVIIVGIYASPCESD